MSQKLVVVVGATGGQGGAVVTALLKAPDAYKFRATTRNTSSDAAKALAAKGVEVVAADMDDLDSLVQAFEGAAYVFGVTDFFASFFTESAEKCMEIEYRQGTNLAKAAAKTKTLEHFIWSTLPDSEKLSDGEIIIPHLQAKAQVDDFIRKDQALLSKTTFLFVGFYAANLFYPPFTPNLLKSSGKYIWTLPCPPSTLVPFISDHTINVGIFAKAILENPKKTLGGQYVLATTEMMTFAEALKVWGKAAGKEDTAVVEISMEDYQVLFGEKFGLELGLMLKLWAKFGDRSWDSSHGKPMTGSELGIGSKDLVMLEDAWKATDWSSF